MNYRNCQSCGMPLARDQKGGGSEKDGSKSSMYCSHCYENGAFVLPNITMEEMKERVNQKLKDFHIPFFLRPLFTRNIRKLERWKNW